MYKFQVGDSVEVVCHPKPEYHGLKGKIQCAYQSQAPRTGPVGAGGKLPAFGSQPTYDVELEDDSRLLTRLLEDWLEPA